MYSHLWTAGWRPVAGVLLALILSGCGPEDEQSSAADDRSTPSLISVAVPSTALAANPVNNGFGFDQYLSYRIQLDLTRFDAELSGGLYVIKLFDDDGNSYYLGQAVELAGLDLQVSLPRHIRRLWLEIFTDQPRGGRVLEEIVL